MWQYLAKLRHVVDGNTVELIVDLGFRNYSTIRFQLAAVDAPNLEQEGGSEASDFISRWFGEHHNECIVETDRRDVLPNQWLAHIYPRPKDRSRDPRTRESLNGQLIDSGYAELFKSGELFDENHS